MTEVECFVAIDAEPKNTIRVFDDRALADRYVAHRQRAGDVGMIVRVEDTRTRFGLLAQWRNSMPAAEIERRCGEAAWLLEEVLAGRVPRPVRGQINNISREIEREHSAQRGYANRTRRGQTSLLQGIDAPRDFSASL